MVRQKNSGFVIAMFEVVLCQIYLVRNFTHVSRKGSMYLNNIIAIIGGGLMGFSKVARSYEMLIAGRLVIGISAGKI